MLSNNSQDSPYKAGDVVYLRLRTTGFEQPVGYEPCLSQQGQETVRAVLKPEVCWARPIDKEGRFVGDIVYAVSPELLIHPAKVIEDMKKQEGR